MSMNPWESMPYYWLIITLSLSLRPNEAERRGSQREFELARSRSSLLTSRKLHRLVGLLRKDRIDRMLFLSSDVHWLDISTGLCMK